MNQPSVIAQKAVTDDQEHYDDFRHNVEFLTEEVLSEQLLLVPKHCQPERESCKGKSAPSNELRIVI